jgi:hypothetical protein
LAVLGDILLRFDDRVGIGHQCWHRYDEKIGVGYLIPRLVLALLANILIQFDGKVGIGHWCRHKYKSKVDIGQLIPGWYQLQIGLILRDPCLFKWISQYNLIIELASGTNTNTDTMVLWCRCRHRYNSKVGIRHRLQSWYRLQNGLIFW